MQTKILSPIARIVLFVLAALLLVLGCLTVAGLLLRPQSTSVDVQESVQLVSNVGQLSFIDGQQMTGENLTLSANLDAPAQMMLPLKSLADFPASVSATRAEVVTSKGRLTLELFPEQAPLTVANFVDLGQKNFYEGLKFHRLEPGAVLQVGDPASKEATNEEELLRLGTGYPGYRIADEFAPGLSHDKVGIVSMANINLNGDYPHSGGSQFFFTLSPMTYLDGRHAIFAQVTDGLDVLEKLDVGDEIIAVEIF